MALELVLRSLLNSKKFVNSSSNEKDWQAISKLIPGATPKQCARKWDEVCENTLFLKPSSKVSQASSNLNLNFVVEYLLHHKDSEESNEEADNHINNSDNKAIWSLPETQVQGGSLCLFKQGPGDKKWLLAGKNCVSKPVNNDSVTDQKKDKDSLVASTKKAKPKPPSPEGPNMVIHVCDESKNLKQDFSCPRDLLVKEMKYFAEYLSLEPQRWEEVDISVHCDVQIFDWLMRYVKRDINCRDDAKPKLEPNNVISILISSDFLRMDSLVTKCINYCHENLSAILSTPCNMNCINDKLVSRISKLFNHTELDAIKDRKDRFKSKLFCKKIEEFLESRQASDSCPDNASTLYRCASCKKLLTVNNQSKVPCVLNRLIIDSRGQLSYEHSRDLSWDINDYLLSLKEKLKSWRDVYWRLWSATTILFCYHCQCYFPCTELGHCRYHTRMAEYSGMKDKDDDSAVVGVYPCCKQKALRYDSIGVLSGCHVKDHVLQPLRNHQELENEPDEESSSPADSESGDQRTIDQSQPSDFGLNNPLIVKDLLAHRDVICVPFQRLVSARTSELNVFHEDESCGSLKSLGAMTQRSSGTISFGERKPNSDSAAALPPIRRGKTSISQRMPSSRRKTAILKQTYYNSTEDEEDDDEERFQSIKDRHFRPVKKKPPYENRQSSSGFKWDPQRSPRWNQDAQREEDSKRMNEVINTMAKLRSAANQEKKQKVKEFPGGIFHKLEHQFRVSIQPPTIKNQASNSQLSTGSPASFPWSSPYYSQFVIPGGFAK